MICDYVRGHHRRRRPHRQERARDLVSERVLSPRPISPGWPREAFAGVGESVSAQGDRVLLRIFDESKVDEVLDLVRAHRGRLLSLSPRTETLEDIFVETVTQT